jgi:hypothetical protein
MAVYKIFPTQDATLYSNYPNMNTGLDAILEASNIIDAFGEPQVSRYLVQFDNTEITDIIDNKISGSQYDVYIKNFIAEAQGLTQPTDLEILPLAQDWNNGTGYFLNIPQTTDGACWNAPLYSGSSGWSLSGTYSGLNGDYDYVSYYNSSYSSPGGGNWYTDSSGSLYVTIGYVVTGYIQSSGGSGSSAGTSVTFKNRDVKDLTANVKNAVQEWYSGSIPNYGFIVKLTSSLEWNPNQNIQPTLKYYSVDTNTIYPPTLEFRWRDYSTVLTGSATGSIVTTSNIKMSLAENPGTFFPESINKFYVNVSPLYPPRVFQTSSLYTNLNYLPTSSYYAIKDLATNEYVINFDDNYTQISSDGNGNYFTVYMSGLEPERYYKILIKSIINGSTMIYDDNYYFKVING